MEVCEQLEVVSLHLPCVYQGSNTPHQAQKHISLSAAPSCLLSNVFFLFVLFCFILLACFEIESHYVMLTVLELTMQTRVALNLQRFACLCLLSAGNKGMCHHHPASCCKFICLTSPVTQARPSLTAWNMHSGRELEQGRFQAFLKEPAQSLKNVFFLTSNAVLRRQNQKLLLVEF